MGRHEFSQPFLEKNLKPSTITAFEASKTRLSQSRCSAAQCGSWLLCLGYHLPRDAERAHMVFFLQNQKHPSEYRLTPHCPNCASQTPFGPGGPGQSSTADTWDVDVADIAVLVLKLVSRHACVADRLPVVVRFPAGPIPRWSASKTQDRRPAERQRARTNKN